MKGPNCLAQDRPALERSDFDRASCDGKLTFSDPETGAEQSIDTKLLIYVQMWDRMQKPSLEAGELSTRRCLLLPLNYLV